MTLFLLPYPTEGEHLILPIKSFLAFWFRRNCLESSPLPSAFPSGRKLTTSWVWGMRSFRTCCGKGFMLYLCCSVCHGVTRLPVMCGAWWLPHDGLGTHLSCPWGCWSLGAGCDLGCILRAPGDFRCPTEPGNGVGAGLGGEGGRLLS